MKHRRSLQESKPNLKAIADMLKANWSLKLYVSGHTDIAGKFEYNVGLSIKRAKAIVKGLANDYGVTAGRLAGKGAVRSVQSAQKRRKTEGTSIEELSSFRCDYNCLNN